MHDFYVMDGKKLIDFKPRHVNYERAFLRKYDEIINSQSDMSMHEMKETYGYELDSGHDWIEDVIAWMPLPEPYRESEDNMERLTYVAENGEVLFHPADLPDDEGITITQLAKDGRYKALEEIAERLANREQAEEQGLLLRLPCKVGSNIYRITDDGVEVAVCREMTVADKEMYIESVTLCDWISFDEIGKSVFLTREEAEAKLKEMEGEHGE